MKFTLRKTGRILLWSLFLQIFVVTQTAQVNASLDAVVKVEPHSNAAPVGGNFTVTIVVTDVQNLFTLDVTLQWNASLLRMASDDVRLGVESYPDGVLHEPLFHTPIQDEGNYSLVATSLGGETPSFSGSGNIARMTFNVISTGSCALNLEAILLSPLGTQIPHTAIDGFFSTTTPEQPIWPYIVIIAAGITTAVVTVVVIYRKRIKRLKNPPCP